MTRSEHLDWCKQRALEYVDSGDLTSAYASMVSDLSKHDETAGHSAIEIGAILMLHNNLNTLDRMRRFIEGFN